MTREELIIRLQDIEWEDFEVKKAEKTIPKNSWETVSAFANTGGGWLVFGVFQQKEEYTITGVKYPEKIEQDFITALRSNQKFNVRISPTCKKYEIEDKTVLAFHIPVSAQKPVYFNNINNTFIRTASGDQRATKEEIDAMYRDQAFGTKDRELTNLNIDALNVSSIKRYRNFLQVVNPSHQYNLLSDEELLQKLQVLKDGKITIAGLLFFGKVDSIENVITDFRIDYLEIPGTSLETASSRYSFRLDQQENIFEYYFAIYPRLLQQINIPFKMTTDGISTEDQPHVQALREALVNMLMHADYFSSSKPRVRVFSNHLEFYNPGGLPKDLKSIMEADISQPRNPVLAKIFRVIKLAETAGYGFDKIFRGWEGYFKTKPQIAGHFDYFIIKLASKTKLKRSRNGVDTELGVGATPETTQKTTQKQQEIIAYLITHPSAGRKEIAAHIDNITEDGVKYNLTVLQQKGIIRRVGPDKGGHW
ncbi:MAG: putative DNA binding domain-containing protein, partial [Candidatus Cloacimonetes bacterium]|nr:putative DNA binding domain-containing protein [Candidatus Cloacimonadota bacterium]